jgi:hypothetical protein
MTILLCCNSFSEKYLPRYRIVIPTGAYPDFLLRGIREDLVCGSP